MAAKLIGEEGTQKGAELLLEEGEEWVIGRDPDACQIVIEDPAASRKHLLCRQTIEGFMLENLSSTNTVEINDEVIEEPQLLQNGDQIRLGNTVFRFYENDEKVIEEEETHDTIVSEEELGEKEAELAKVDFDLMKAYRWCLKVVGGPNTGAEFPMDTGNAYLIGTDTGGCDIVFHDVSVSRHHAKLTLKSNKSMMIEDLDSKNGVLVDGESIEKEEMIQPNQLISLGTTAFMVCDREEEATTVVSALLTPSEAQSGGKEGEYTETGAEPSEGPEIAYKEEKASSLPILIFLAVLAAIFVTMGVGVTQLFQGKEIVAAEVDYDQMIQDALDGYPQISYLYNKSTGRLLLLGHVLTPTDRSQILYNLQGFRFIKKLDDNVIIDEYIWQEANQIIGKNPNWQGVTMHSPRPGTFILSGYLKSAAQSETLDTYLNLNFLYPDLIERKIIVEENVVGETNTKLNERGFYDVRVEIINGEVNLTGTTSVDSVDILKKTIEEIRAIHGVRAVRNFVVELAAEEAKINLSDQYEVTGYSNQGDVSLNIVINGRIIARGDVVDGMTVTSIRPGTVFLEKDGFKYRIDFQK